MDSLAASTARAARTRRALFEEVRVVKPAGLFLWPRFNWKRTSLSSACLEDIPLEPGIPEGGRVASPRPMAARSGLFINDIYLKMGS